MKKFTLFIISLLIVGNVFADMAATPAWPLTGSDTDYVAYSKKLEIDITTTKDINPAPTNGWSGGASFTPPDNFQIDGNEMPVMQLSNVNLIQNNGYQTLSANNPPLPPVVIEEESFIINEYGVSQNAGEKEYATDRVREWVAKEGKSLREVVEEWATLEGWEVVWDTQREYPLQASAIFKGRFTDVASGLVRTFGRASPPPYAKFYFGNKVLVIKTLEDENAD